MYGLPTDFDFAAFADRTLEQVSFAAWNVVLHFGDDLFIQLESSWSVRIDPSQPETRECHPLTHSALLLLIEKTIARASTPGSGTLTLYFTDGAVLECFDDKPNYECYQVWINGKRIIV